MDRKVLLALYDKEQRIDIEYPDLFKEIKGGVVRFTGPSERHNSNFVLFSRLTDENADDVIQAQIDYYSRYRLSFEWKVYDHDKPPDLRARLIVHGFKPRERDAIMVINVREVSPVILQPVEADVRRLTEPGQIKVMIGLLEEVWHTDFSGLQTLLEEDLWKRPSFSSIYMAYVDDQPVCAGWVQFTENSQFASLWGGSTLPQFRDRGYYTAVMAVRVQEAIRRGYSFLTIDASRLSRPIAEKYGFQLLTYAHACMWHGK